MTGLIYATIAVLWLVVLVPVVIGVDSLIRSRRNRARDHSEPDSSTSGRARREPRPLTVGDWWLLFRRSLRLFPIANLDADARALAPALANRRTRLFGTVMMVVGIAVMVLNAVLFLTGTRPTRNVAWSALVICGVLLAYFGYFILRLSWIAPRRRPQTARAISPGRNTLDQR